MAPRKKVTENHEVEAVAEETPVAEQLLEEQGITFGEDSEDDEVAEAGEPKEDTKTKILEDESIVDEAPQASTERPFKILLTGAASYAGCGLRFVKGKPVEVEREIYEKLIGTGLFIGAK